MFLSYYSLIVLCSYCITVLSYYVLIVLYSYRITFLSYYILIVLHARAACTCGMHVRHARVRYVHPGCEDNHDQDAASPKGESSSTAVAKLIYFCSAIVLLRGPVQVDHILHLQFARWVTIRIDLTEIIAVHRREENTQDG